MTKSLVLFSGGIDSTTALYWAVRRYPSVEALTVNYGQRHRVEITGAKRIAKQLGIRQKLLHIDLTQIGGSSLTDPEIAVPHFEDSAEIENGIPPTYVPFRNGILLSAAASWAEVSGCSCIVVGFNVIDSPNYPDTREVFVQAMEQAVNEGTRGAFTGDKIRIRAPFLQKKKSEIIEMGLSLGVDYSQSISCYSGKEIPCGTCSSCLLRKKAWEEIGREDPLIRRLMKEGRI